MISFSTFAVALAVTETMGQPVGVQRGLEESRYHSFTGEWVIKADWKFLEQITLWNAQAGPVRRQALHALACIASLNIAGNITVYFGSPEPVSNQFLSFLRVPMSRISCKDWITVSRFIRGITTAKYNLFRRYKFCCQQTCFTNLPQIPALSLVKLWDNLIVRIVIVGKKENYNMTVKVR